MHLSRWSSLWGQVYFNLATNSSAHLPPEIIRSIYQDTANDNWTLRFYSMTQLPGLMYMDSLNDEKVGIEASVQQRLTNLLLYADNEINRKTLLQLIIELNGREQDYLVGGVGREIFHDACLAALFKTATDFDRKKVFAIYAQEVGIENARSRMKAYAKRRAGSQEQFLAIERALGFVNSDFAYADLVDLYEDINFGKQYAPNAELQQYEGNLLMEKLQNAKKILELGIGDGRTLGELADWHELIGIDIVDDHIARAQANYPKEKYPNISIVKSDWHYIEIDDEESPGKKKRIPAESVDAVVCLGRSFLHNTTIEDAIECMGEAYRVLKSGGILIIDIPDLNEGEYKQQRERVSKVAEELGIYRGEEGYIVDGPDPKHQFDRLVPTENQFRAIAAKAGFVADIREIQRRPYGDGNVNMYWTFRKLAKGERMTDEQANFNVLVEDEVYTDPMYLSDPEEEDLEMYRYALEYPEDSAADFIKQITPEHIKRIAHDPVRGIIEKYYVPHEEENVAA